MHTPGPWTIISHVYPGQMDEQWGHSQIMGPGGFQIAVVYGDGPDSIDGEVQRNNGRLLLAVPMMLAALEEIAQRTRNRVAPDYNRPLTFDEIEKIAMKALTYAKQTSPSTGE